MFSINIYLRLGVIILCIGGGVVLSILYGFWYAFPFFLIGIVLLVGYILFGTVQSAAKMMQTMDIAGAENRMKLTLSPRLLYSANRAYFFMLKGTIAQHNKDPETSEFYFQKAKDTKLPTDNERAMVNIQLANMQANRGNWPMAKQLYREIRNMKVTEPQIKEQVEEFGKVIKNSGNIKAAQSGRFRGAMSNQSKKRRRPKMR